LNYLPESFDYQLAGLPEKETAMLAEPEQQGVCQKEGLVIRLPHRKETIENPFPPPYAEIP